MVSQQPRNRLQQQWIYENLFEGLYVDLKMDRNVVCKDTCNLITDVSTSLFFDNKNNPVVDDLWRTDV